MSPTLETRMEPPVIGVKGAWGLGARIPGLPLPLSLSQGREQTEEMLRPDSWPISHVIVMERQSPGWDTVGLLHSGGHWLGLQPGGGTCLD